MNEQDLEYIKSLLDNNAKLEWYDWNEGRYYPILRFGLCQPEDRVDLNGTPYSEFMNTQFVISELPFMVVDFYSCEPDDFYILKRNKLFQC